jgi:hypothetical protein
MLLRQLERDTDRRRRVDGHRTFLRKKQKSKKQINPSYSSRFPLSLPPQLPLVWSFLGVG